MLNNRPRSPEYKVTQVVQRLLAEHSIDRTIRPNESLSEVGLNSFDMINLMLFVEAEFDLQIPDTNITPANFKSISTISSLVDALLNKA